MTNQLKNIVRELARASFYSGAISFTIVWVLEEVVKGEGLQSYLQSELVTLILTLGAVYTAIIGLVLTQVTSLRAMAMADPILKGNVDNTLQSINDALYVSFVELVILVGLSIASTSLSGSKLLRTIEWSYFAVDVTNVAVLVWAVWLLWDMGASQFLIFGKLSEAVSKTNTNSQAEN